MTVGHWISGFAGGLLLAGQAQALVLTDRWAGDQNTITVTQQDDANQVFRWEENYNEDNLTPYPSPDGFGVVNAPGDPGCPAGDTPCYFDKIYNLNNEAGIWEFQFGVFNNSPFDWRDFHLEFFDSTFQTPLSNILVGAQNGIFPIIQLMPDAVWFSGATQLSGPSFLQNFITLTVNLDEVRAVGGSFGIRQIATTPVPAPATFGLIGLGLAGLGFQRYRARASI